MTIAMITGKPFFFFCIILSETSQNVGVIHQDIWLEQTQQERIEHSLVRVGYSNEV